MKGITAFIPTTSGKFEDFIVLISAGFIYHKLVFFFVFVYQLGAVMTNKIEFRKKYTETDKPFA